MSLTSAMHIGRTGLTASQIAIQVAGNNMANAATPGYSRQIARLNPLRAGNSNIQLSIGAGAQVTAVQRQVDNAIQARLWGATSDDARQNALAGVYGQIESILGELGDNDLSSELSSFFSAWSERANQTRSSASVVQQGDRLANFVQRLRSDLVDQSRQADRTLGAAVEGANTLIDQIAHLNGEISGAEIAGQQANVLRDQRDQLITELSAYMEVSVVDRGREGVDVLVGSMPVVLGSVARGVQVKRTTDADGNTQVAVATIQGQSELTINSGFVGAAIASRDGTIENLIGRVDDIARQLIWQVNRLHSTGVAGNGYAALSGSTAFGTADRALALNDPANSAMQGLPGQPVNGGFVVRVRQESTGAMTTVRIDVDLDGLTNAGLPGTADDTTADSIRAQINAIAGVNASFNAEGKLTVSADEGFTFSFEEDTSGALAALGMNSFYTGTDGSSLAVRSDLKNDASKLAAGRYVNGQLVENGTALQLAQVQDAPLETLGGQSLAGLWRDAVQEVGGKSASAASAASAATLVRESLESQRAAVSGVSLDEESVNLLQFQRQYQASARLITVVDELTQTLIGIV